MKKIELTQGKFALVDDDDFDRVNQFKWYAYKPKRKNLWYARRNAPKDGGRQMTVLLHHVILTGHKQIDHKNGDGLDCQKHNLRPATAQQNGSNRRRHFNNVSGFKGVHWRESSRKWRSVLCFAGENISLGYFDNKADAARAYDGAAKKYFGEFAKLNFPEKQ